MSTMQHNPALGENPENNSSTEICRLCKQAGKTDDCATCPLCMKEKVWVMRSFFKQGNNNYSNEHLTIFIKVLRWAEVNETGWQAKTSFKKLIKLNNSLLLYNSFENCYVSSNTVLFTMMVRRVKNNDLDERNAWDRLVPNLVRYQIFSFLSIADATRGIEQEEIEKWADNVLKLQKSRRKHEKYIEWLSRPRSCFCCCDYHCQCY